MLRNFNFEKVPGTDPTVEPRLGVTNSPYPFDVKISPRKMGVVGIMGRKAGSA